jgi:hypothetical protein
MDSLQHGVHGAVIVLLPACAVGCTIGDSDILSHAITALATVFACIGAMPDAAGEIEPENPGESKRWNWYIEAHQGAINRWMIDHWYYIFPVPWILHTWLDTFTHGEGKRWWVWNEGLWKEVVGWAVPVAVCGIVLAVAGRLG